MKHLKLAVFGLGIGLAACSPSTTPMDSAASLQTNPRNAPQQGTPPNAAAVDCSGKRAQQGGGSAYLNCLQKHE